MIIENFLSKVLKIWYKILSKNLDNARAARSRWSSPLRDSLHGIQESWYRYNMIVIENLVQVLQKSYKKPI